jgi:hypothetical protein
MSRLPVTFNQRASSFSASSSMAQAARSSHFSSFARFLPFSVALHPIGGRFQPVTGLGWMLSKQVTQVVQGVDRDVGLGRVRPRLCVAVKRFCMQRQSPASMQRRPRYAAPRPG